MRIGFVGTGVITEAIVTGLSTLPDERPEIVVSPRNAQRAAQLAARFPNVAVAASNQDVIDQSEIVVLAVIPQQASQIIGQLRFRADQSVISLLASVRLSTVAELVAPAQRISRAVPMPTVANHTGPIAVHPMAGYVDQVFGKLGTVVATATEEQLDGLAVLTALMAPYYQLLETIVDWADRAQIDRAQALSLLAAMLTAFSDKATQVGQDDLPWLIAESQTPGGLNAKALQTLLAEDAFQPWQLALDAVAQLVEDGL